MGQNTSSAVMQQRKEARDALDDFPTPPWATRAICELLKTQYVLANHTCREPCANRGYMVAPLEEYFAEVQASDVHDYGAGFEIQDYLFGPAPDRVDWTFMNPPFRLAQEFIERALQTSNIGCAVLVRSAFLEGIRRHKELFSVTPPTKIFQFTERVVMHKGCVTEKGSTATSYSWLVFECGGSPASTEFHWIKKCRRSLERSGDYEQLGGST